jgi:hypothetical protein
LKKIKPIHKFNGGRGATLCHKCNRIITEGMTEDLYCEEHGGKPSYKYKLVRSRDNMTVTGTKVLWLEWNENGTFKKEHEQPTIGASVVVNPQYGTYTWLTTPMLSYTEEDGVITFNTENSTYKLYSNA